jgi:uncharacterized protein (DUF2062 family)
MNPTRWLSERWHRLVRLEAHPDVVALGFSIGIFLGFTPLFGLKTLLALGVAWLCGASRVAAVIGVTLHDLLLPFMPVVLRLEYQIGFWVLSHPHHLPPKLHLHYHMHLHDMLSWTKIFTTTLPLLVGSLVIGLPLAAVSYYLVRAAHRRSLLAKEREAAREG